MPDTPDNRGAVHVDLVGAAELFRYRPERLAAAALDGDLTCEFEHDGGHARAAAVLDVSSTGIGVAPAPGAFFAQGTQLGEVVVRFRGAPMWTGSATVVYQVQGPPPRLGLKLTSSLLEVEQIQLRDSALVRALVKDLGAIQRQIAALPEAWRAGIADLASLLQGARVLFDDIEGQVAPTDVRMREEEAPLFEAFHESWGPRFHEAQSRAWALSAGLPPEATPLARAYATRVLYPLVAGCPMHRRAFEKPLGYAGDYQMIRLYFAERHQGATLFDRFLHYAAQHYRLGRTVVARTSLLQRAVAEVLQSPQPRRVVSLACGPGIELQRFLSEASQLPPGSEIVLIDQDQEALAYCHGALTRIAASRPLRVELHALHFSLRQLLKPRDAAEREVTSRVLRGVDLVYASGLADYVPDPVAVALTAALHAMLAPGGRMLLGNLKLTPETSWIMEYVLGWHLEYREPEAMLGFARGLAPAPSQVAIIEDDTGRCMFLDVRRPGGAP
jgi:extracellular factor (EF) 3-hydroxypalmitic acid methyl ester biosynthesis protein